MSSHVLGGCCQVFRIATILLLPDMTPHGLTMGFGVMFMLVAAVVGLLMLVILVMVTVATRMRSHDLNTDTCNPASQSSVYSDAQPSNRPAGLDPLKKVSLTQTYSPLTVCKETASTMVNSHSPTQNFPLRQCYVAQCSAPTRAITMENIQCTSTDKEEGREALSLSCSIQQSYRCQNITPTRSYSHSHGRSTHNPVFHEQLNPSMLCQRTGPQDHTLQALPFAPTYNHLRSLGKHQQPIMISRDHIHELHSLGVGQFGQVVLAKTKGLSPKDLRLGSSTNRAKSILVAVKKLKGNADGSLRESFEHEIRFMGGLKHSNVVRLLGVCRGEEPFLVMEYMENGDLHGFLCKQTLVPDTVDHINDNEVTPLILMYVAVQIANGMRYLASQRFVHRDLATRNCLVGRDFVVKVSDFGMSCRIYQSFYYLVQGRMTLPIRWMAFESFYGQFSVKSDAWSYGVTMWEIFSLAQSEPYSDMSDEEVIADAIKGAGRRLLPKPPTCSKEVYDVMLRCWVHEPVMRADFEEVYSRMFLLYTEMSAHAAC